MIFALFDACASVYFQCGEGYILTAEKREPVSYESFTIPFGGWDSGSL